MGDAWGSAGAGGSGFGASTSSTSKPVNGNSNGHTSSTPSLSYPSALNGFFSHVPDPERLPEPAEGLGYDPAIEGWALGRQRKVEVQMRDELEGMLGWRHNTWFVACEVRRFPSPLSLCADPS